MAKIELTPDNKVGVGIYKLDEKSYVYRISVKRNGKRYDTTRKTDKDTEKPFTSKSAAERARAKELYEIELEKKSQRKKSQLMKYSIIIFVIQLLIKLKAQLPSNIVFIKITSRKFLVIPMFLTLPFRMSGSLLKMKLK